MTDPMTIPEARAWAEQRAWNGPLGPEIRRDFLADLDRWEAEGHTHVEKEPCCQTVTGHEVIFAPDGLFGPRPPYSFVPVKGQP